MTHTLHPLAEEYLDRLDRAAAHLLRGRRRELVDEIEAHLREALGPEPTEAEVRTVLDRLGTPEEIADAEAPRPAPVAPRPRMGVQEWAAVLLLPLGGFVFGVGWFAGVILLWSSHAWTTVDKLIGTLLVPGGLVTAVLVMGIYGLSAACSPGQGRVCDSGPDYAAIGIVALAIVPIVSAIYLARRADLNRRG